MNLKIIYSILLVIILLSIGTMYFHKEENWSYVDSFYFSTMTLTTIGYGDITPTKDKTKIFASFYAIFGIGIVLYVLGSVIGGYLFNKEKLFDRFVHRIQNFKSTKGKKAVKKKKAAKKLAEEIIKK
jgi:voltage-gated potassium channel